MLKLPIKLVLKVGGFVPQCDDHGNYKPMQTHGGIGLRWCVDIISGKLIDGTTAGPGQKDPVCSSGTFHNLDIIFPFFLFFFLYLFNDSKIS